MGNNSHYAEKQVILPNLGAKLSLWGYCPICPSLATYGPGLPS